MNLPLSDDHLNRPILEYVRQDFIRIDEKLAIGAALESVQRSGKNIGRIVYFYVVDDEQHLRGIIPTRRLLLNPPETPVAEIMVTNVVAVPEDATLLDACDLFLFHRFLALPVVDSERKLKGVVDVELYTDELTDLARQTEHNDIFQLIGVHVSSVRQASPFGAFRNRFPWLVCNITGGLLCAAIAGLYQPVLDRVLTLALFIPIVLALAESVSIQSLTLTIQSQHGRAFRWRDLIWNVLRETPVGLLLGGVCGLLVAVVAWLWQGAIGVALCLLLSIALSITLAALYGLLVPTLLKSFQRDPKVASGPITLALADLTTLFCYFGIASALL